VKEQAARIAEGSLMGKRRLTSQISEILCLTSCLKLRFLRSN